MKLPIRLLPLLCIAAAEAAPPAWEAALPKGSHLNPIALNKAAGEAALEIVKGAKPFDKLFTNPLSDFVVSASGVKGFQKVPPLAITEITEAGDSVFRASRDGILRRAPACDAGGDVEVKAKPRCLFNRVRRAG